MIRVDLHIHTVYSKDGFITPRELIYRCKKKRIDCVAICDHNTIQGALQFKDEVPLKIIVGEEVDTSEGEVIGLFLKKEIFSGLSPTETIEEIKEQDGLVYLPHPFDAFRKATLTADALNQIFKDIDIVEVFNSRNLLSKSNKKALQFGKRNGFALAVGSDAHTRYEIGNSYLEMEDFEVKEDFLENLKNAKLVTKRTSIFVRMWIKFLKMLQGIE
jgi:hypothetical protein